MKQRWNGKQQRGHVRVAAWAMEASLPVAPEKKPDYDPIDAGKVRIHFLVKERTIENSYRFQVANRFYHRDKEQWLDLADLPDLRKALDKLEAKGKRAKQKLEGGLLRRLFRAVF